MNEIIYVIFIASIIYLWIKKLKYYAQMLQQNSYKNDRFTKWYKKYRKKRKGILIEILFFILILVSILQLYYSIALLFLAVYVLAIHIRYTYRFNKKPLVETNRVKRLYVGTIVTTILIVGASFVVWRSIDMILISALGVILLYPFLIYLSNLLLIPFETHINNSYIQDAKRILKLKKSLTTIAITGSYGKTSTKHFLNTILNNEFTTLMTPGSYNTTMGVVRTIREYLKPIHEVFIVEMGAKQIGDIKEISEIVNQDYSVLTAIGPQHLDTFKSISNIQKGKSEIIEYAKATSTSILNLDYSLIEESEIVKNKKNKIFYASNKSTNSWYIDDIQYSNSGMSFNIYDIDGKLYLKAKTRVLGEFNASNILAAVVLADKLGMKKSKIKQGIQQIEPVKHRLELIHRKEGGFTVIDDSFNSNPKGAQMAIEVLKNIKGKQKYVVTPGMIELGNKQYDLNKEFGVQLSRVCNKVVLVGKKQTQPIYDGLIQSDFSTENIITVDNLKEASEFININIKSGDIVLYENDLPDTYNE